MITTRKEKVIAGNKAGGAKTAKTNVLRYGADFYSRIGKKGGSRGNTGGFASDIVGKDGLTGRERASKAGRLGGLKSRRPKQKKVEDEDQED